MLERKERLNKILWIGLTDHGIDKIIICITIFMNAYNLYNLLNLLMSLPTFLLVEGINRQIYFI